MSLIGSLEDLGLGDILQIISLSQKSGILTIRGGEGEGRIVLVSGMVRGAGLKSGPGDLRALLVDGRFIAAAEFDAAREDSRQRGISIEECIAARTTMTPERIDSLRRECVEAAVMAMFGWESGEFSFDVGTEPLTGGTDLILPTGINAQYLAMEGTRLGDESSHLRGRGPDGDDGDDGDGGCDQGDDRDAGAEDAELSAHAMFGVDEPTPANESASLEAGFAAWDGLPLESSESSESSLPSRAVEALGRAVAERALADDFEDSLAEDLGPEFAIPLAATADEPSDLEDPRAADFVLESMPAVLATGGENVPLVSRQAPLVVIDPDLLALEWIKKSLSGSFSRIHIFQRWDLGLNPIRQYLARAVRPCVLLHADAPGDPLSGIRSPADFARRLKAQQPQIRIVLLVEHGSHETRDRGAADAVVVRPSHAELRSPRQAARLDEIASTLRTRLGLAGPASSPEASEPVSKSNSSVSPPSTDAAEKLGKLKAVTQRLSDASNRGEVLPLVIRFASEAFDRVALFMVRGDAVIGIAQAGLDRAGGPSDSEFRKLEMARDGCAWFRSVLEAKAPIRSGPTDSGDFILAARLGHSAAEEAYLAPIESAGEVVAILYADNLPAKRPVAESHALEVVLHHAGLALERALLTRALAEAEGAQAD